MQLHSDQFDFSETRQRDRLWFCVEARRRPTARWQRRFAERQELDACRQRRSKVNVRQMETANIGAALLEVGKECRTRSWLVIAFWNNALQYSRQVTTKVFTRCWLKTKTATRSRGTRKHLSACPFVRCHCGIVGPTVVRRCCCVSA